MGRGPPDEGAGPSRAKKEEGSAPRAKRAKQGAEEEEAAGAPPAAATAAVDRRAGMAAVARRRAAHFANYQPAEEEEGGAEGQDAGGDNPHTGGSNARSLGPWSSAVQLVNARERALELRKEKILDGAKASPAGAAAQHWAPRRDPQLGPRPVCDVPPLFELALRLVEEYIEDVESLEGLPDMVKSRIAAAVCRQRRMSPEVFSLFTQGRPCELCVPDCTQMDAAALAEALHAAASQRLERLDLGMCGRGMTDASAISLAGACGSFPALRALHLGGAYRLSDVGLAALLTAAPGLDILALPHCSRLDGAAIERFPELVPGLRELDLDECRGLSSATLTTALSGLPQLHTLGLSGVVEVDDALLAALAPALPLLKRLRLAHCGSLTDEGVSALAQLCTGLEELCLDDCSKVTSLGVSALARHCKALHTLSLQRCIKVEDSALSELAQNGALRCLAVNGVTQLSGAFLESLAGCCHDKLEELDASWCRGIAYQRLGRLVDACPRLRRLHLWGCTQIADEFLLGHGNSELQIAGRGERLYPVPAF